MNPPQAKFRLKEKTALLQSQVTNLFGKELHQDLLETVKAKKRQTRITQKRGQFSGSSDESDQGEKLFFKQRANRKVQHHE